MTIPTMSNCAHSEAGWCLTCVGELAAQRDNYRAVLDEIHQMAAYPDDQGPDVSGQRYQQLTQKIADVAGVALQWADLAHRRRILGAVLSDQDINP